VLKLNPQYIYQNGTPVFVVLPYDEYLVLKAFAHEHSDMLIVEEEQVSISDKKPYKSIEVL
jgi:hypothetical protein